MTYKMTVIASSLSVVALVLAAGETFADPGAPRGAGLAPSRPAFPQLPGRSMHQHHLRGTGGFWPAGGGVFYGLPNDAPTVVEVPAPKTSDDLRYTCVYDIPWDYVHRCPQYTTPRAYVPD